MKDFAQASGLYRLYRIRRSPTSPLHLTHSTFAESLSTSSLPFFNSIRYQLRGNSVIDKFSFIWRFYALDSFFFTHETWSQFSWYVRSQNSGIWSAKNPHVLHEDHVHLSKIGVWCTLSRKQTLGTLSPKGHLLPKIVLILWLSSFLCWKRMNGIAGFSNIGQLPVLRKQRKLSCRTSVIALSGVAFGRHDLQILRHLTFFCGGIS